MSPAVARPLLHTAHLLTFVVVFATGMLLFVPGLRAAVTGGYSLVIRETHRWGGVAFAAAPGVLIATAGVRSLFAAPAARTLRSYWQDVHIALTVLITIVFTLTGFVLWGRRSVPESMVEVSRTAHDWLTYIVVVLVVAHLCEVGAATLIARIKAAATPARSPT
jgi:cytochrome b subunit of formate dehydrogenase